jgi:hypothetical protein
MTCFTFGVRGIGGSHANSGEEMTLGLVAALTGLCFAGAVAAITFGLSR